MADRDVKEILPHHIDSGTSTTGQALFPDGSGGHENRSIAESDVVNLVTDLASKVAKAGDTMTGALTIDVTSGTIQTWKIAGVVKAVIDGSGNLIIGTDPGGTKKLRVTGGGYFTESLTSADSLNFDDGVAASSIFPVNTDDVALSSNRNLEIWPGLAVSATFKSDGSVVLGTDPGGSERLRVSGGVQSVGMVQARAVGSILTGYMPGVFGTGAKNILLGHDATYGYLIQALEQGIAWRDLSLQPMGGHLWLCGGSGDVIIGPSDPGGSETLRVSGGARFTAATIQQGTSHATARTTWTRTDGTYTGGDFHAGLSDTAQGWALRNASSATDLLAVLSNGNATASGNIAATGGTVTAGTKTRMHHDTSTGEYGMQVKLTNKTGSNTVKGQIVSPSSTTDMAFNTTAGNAYDPCHIVYEAGVADGSEAWVWCVGSICQVLLKNSTASTRDYWVKVSDTAGRADATNANPPGGTISALEDHGREIGHCIESKTAGTDVLARITFHLN